MTNEERFENILGGLHFELKRSENDRFFLYDTRMEEFYPREDIEETDLAVKPDENEVYHIEYDGYEVELMSAGNDVLEEALGVDFDELYSDMTVSSAPDVMAVLDTFVCDSYLDDINDVCDTTVENFDEAFELEQELLAQAKCGNEAAANTLDCLGGAFDDMRFIVSMDIDNVDLNKVYELQEEAKAKHLEEQRRSEMDKAYAGRPDYCGIEGVKFIYNGDYSDPELYYNGKIYNEYDLEDRFYDDYEEDVKEGLFKGKFGEYLHEHANDVRAVLDELQPSEKTASKKRANVERD